MSTVRQGRDIFRSQAINLIILRSQAINLTIQSLTTNLIILQSQAISLSLKAMSSLPSRNLSLLVNLILTKKSNLSLILDLFRRLLILM